MADARATLRCPRQRSVCLCGMAEEQATRQGAYHMFGFGGALMNAPRQTCRKQLEAIQNPAVGGPNELVRFVAVEQIELGQSFVDRRFDTQIEDSAPDSVRPQSRVVSVL